MSQGLVSRLALTSDPAQCDLELSVIACSGDWHEEQDCGTIGCDSSFIIAELSVPVNSSHFPSCNMPCIVN